MPAPRSRRPRAALLLSAATIVPLLAVPALASADVTATAIDAPAPDALLQFTSIDPAQQTVSISGTSTGGVAGDEVDVICTTWILANRNSVPVASNVRVGPDGRFAVTAPVPLIPCRLHAVPAGSGVGASGNPPGRDADLAAFVGPRVLAGALVPLTADDVPAVESFLSARPQRLGYGTVGGLLRAAAGVGTDPDNGGGAAAGLTQAFYLEDATVRPILDGGAVLPTVTGDDVADIDSAQLVVDGTSAHVTPELGTDRIGVLSKTFDPASGDVQVVESAPIALVFTDGSGGTTKSASGIALQRTFRQDHDGRVFTFHDEFRSTDGGAHRVEARYQQAAGIGAGPNADTAYRIPWTTGDAYVSPVSGRAFGPSTTTPATVYARVTSKDGTPGVGGEVAFAYDGSLADGAFVDGGALLTRAIRDVPAGGSATVSQRIVQATTPADLAELLRATDPNPPGEDPAGPPAGPPAVPPAGPIGDVKVPGLVTAPPPVGGATVAPSTPAVFSVRRLQSATRKVLLTRNQAVRLAGGKAITVTVAGAPAGTYGVTVRRGSKGGAAIASGRKTLRTAGRLSMKLRLTAEGRRWFASRTGRTRRTLRMHVTVSWTPARGQRRTSSEAFVTRVR